MVKIISLIVLLIMVLGLAHWIEITARPSTGRTGVRVSGDGHEH